jgi:formyltetrahydrofolate-dependent phosphoribosylglycinamide formyltransferase
MAGGKRIAVLISGFGSNLQALIDAIAAGQLGAEIALVAADRADAFGLQRAQQAGIATLLAVPTREQRRDPRARERYDAKLAAGVAMAAPDLIVLAGFMRVLSPAFLDRFAGRVINLHPALPGTFAGTRAIERAFDAAHAGAIERTGVMVHWVVPAVDAGPVIVSEEVPIASGDTLEALTARVHQVEQRLLVEAVRRCLAASD